MRDVRGKKIQDQSFWGEVLREYTDSTLKL